MSTLLASDRVVQTSDSFGFRTFPEFPVFTRPGRQFESHLRHRVFAVQSLFRRLVCTKLTRPQSGSVQRGHIDAAGSHEAMLRFPTWARARPRLVRRDIAGAKVPCAAERDGSRPIRASRSCPRGRGMKRYFESKNCFNIRQIEGKKALSLGWGLVPDVRFGVFQVDELLVRWPGIIAGGFIPPACRAQSAELPLGDCRQNWPPRQERIACTGRQGVQVFC